MTTTADPSTQSGAMSSRDRGVIATLLVATFVVILNETIMGVALPELMADLEVGARTGQWLSTAFLLTMAVVIPTTGFLLQRLSTRTVFVLALGLFSAGTLLAAVSPGFWLLLPARIVQACGTAIMLPLLMTTILTLVPAHRRGVVMGNVSIAISVAPAIGPTVSGVILHFFPWRFMFIAVLPIAIGALVYGALRLVDIGERGTTKLDLVSVVLSVPAFGGVVYGLSQLGASPTVALGSLAVGVLSLVVFGIRQLRLGRSAGETANLARGRGPLLDLGAFRFPMFSLSVALLCIAMMGLFGVIILLPIYLQNVHGIGALQTGLMLLPGGLLMGLLGPTVGKLFDRYGPKGLTIIGSSLLIVTMWRFSTVEPTTPIWLLVLMHMTMSLALACLFTPAFTTALNPLPPNLYSHGSAILSTLQQVAGAAGTALLVAIMAARMSTQIGNGVDPVLAQNNGIQAAFMIGALICVGALVCAVFMRPVSPPEHGHGPGHGPGPGTERSVDPVADAGELR